MLIRYSNLKKLYEVCDNFKIMTLYFSSIIACLICFCKSPEFSEEYVQKSELIVEAEILSIKLKEKEDDNLEIKFRILYSFKGEKLKTFILHTDNSTCGYYLNKDENFLKYNGKVYLLYLNKVNDEYSYLTCDNRMIEKPNLQKNKGSFYSKEQFEKDLFNYCEEFEKIKEYIIESN